MFDLKKMCCLNIKVTEVEETPIYPLTSMENHRFNYLNALNNLRFKY